MPSDTGLAPFSDAAALMREALRSYLPPDPVSVAAFAEAHRWLDNRGGGYVGRWRHEEAPYLVGPMEALGSRSHLAVAVAGPGRSGKTAIGENWLLQSVGADPADMLWYEPTDEALESYVKRVVNPMIDLHDGLKARLGQMPVDRSIHFKRFGSMWVEFLAASYANLIGKSAGRIVIDEIDACPETLGDVYTLADVRRQSFGVESMILALSHPDRAEGTDPDRWVRGIMRLYGQSDRRRWWWPCPGCNGFSSPNPGAERSMALHYAADAPLDEIREQARLLCPLCGMLIEDGWRRAMNVEGRWAGLGQTVAEDGAVAGELARRDIAGFWIVGVMSPFMIGGIGALARDLVAAQREAEQTGDLKNVRSVAAKRLGIPPEPLRQVGSISASSLAERAEEGLALGEVAEGVRFLTGAIDVQANRFEVLVRGWGVRGESWVVAVRRIEAEPAVDPDAWDALFGWMVEAEYPLAGDTSRVMRVRAWGFDTGGAPGVTQQAYDAWRRWRGKRRIVLLGRAGGRDGWSVTPLKGSGSPNAPRLQVVYPDAVRRDRRASAGGQVPLGQFASNAFKDDLAGQLARSEPGPWALHVPAALRSAEPPHAWFEQLVAEVRRPNGAWVKTSTAARNEALDLMVMAHVVAHLHGLGRIDWDRAPAWAEDRARNALVGPARQAGAETGAPAPAALAVPPGPGVAMAAAARPAEEMSKLRRLMARMG